MRQLVTGEGGPEYVGLLPLPSTLAAAAGAGQLPVVQHLRRHGCPWEEEAGAGEAEADERYEEAASKASCLYAGVAGVTSFWARAALWVAADCVPFPAQ